MSKENHYALKSESAIQFPLKIPKQSREHLYPDIHPKIITKFLNKAHQSINGELTTETSIIYYLSRFGQILY